MSILFLYLEACADSDTKPDTAGVVGVTGTDKAGCVGSLGAAFGATPIASEFCPAFPETAGVPTPPVGTVSL